MRGRVSCRYWIHSPHIPRTKSGKTLMLRLLEQLNRVLVFSRPVFMDGLSLLASERRVVWIYSSE